MTRVFYKPLFQRISFRTLVKGYFKYLFMLYPLKASKANCLSLISNKLQALAWCTGDNPSPRCHTCCVGWYCQCQILNSSSRINFNWFNIINLDWFFLPYIFKSLVFKTNLTCSYVLLLDIVSIITQWASVNLLYQKRQKTDIFN